jgi:hypothetical protein
MQREFSLSEIDPKVFEKVTNSLTVDSDLANPIKFLLRDFLLKNPSSAWLYFTQRYYLTNINHKLAVSGKDRKVIIQNRKIYYDRISFDRSLDQFEHSLDIFLNNLKELQDQDRENLKIIFCEYLATLAHDKAVRK